MASSCFDWRKIPLDEPVCVSSHWHYKKWFTSSLTFFENLQKNVAKQIVTYHSKFTALRCPNVTVATCSIMPKKQATSNSFANNFYWMWLMLKDPYSWLIFYFQMHTFNIIHLCRRCTSPLMHLNCILRVC